MPADDAVQFGERLDLVDHDAAHLGGRFRGLLRQFQNAALELVAGLVELRLHLARHVPHARQHIGEAIRRLPEDRVGFADRLFVDRAHHFAGTVALLLGGFTHQFELIGDRAGAAAGGFGNHPADFAGACFGTFQRLVEQCGEALQPLIEVLGLRVEGRDQSFERRRAVR